MKKGRTVLQAKRYGTHSCGPATTLLTAIRLMVEDDVRSLVVQDEHGHLQGVITRVQILDAHLAHDDWGSRLVKDHMVRDVPVVAPQALLADAARALLKSPLHEVVVVLDDGGERRPVAMLTDADLAYHLVREG